MRNEEKPTTAKPEDSDSDDDDDDEVAELQREAEELVRKQEELKAKMKAAKDKGKINKERMKKLEALDYEEHKINEEVTKMKNRLTEIAKEKAALTKK